MHFDVVCLAVFAFVYNKLWKKKNIHYRESDFSIYSIDHIVEYKYFLFIRADKRWYFIKAEEEEKAMLLSKLNGNSNITFTKIEEPFDLQAKKCWLMVGITFLIQRLKRLLSGWVKNIIIAITVIVTIYLVLFLAWNLFLYSISFTVKVEQYDKHIALYVENTFVRTEFRYPYYMYEENWLFMRKLSDDELSKSIWKYGNPEDYYNK